MIERGMGSMGVIVRKGEGIDKAIRRFKKKVDSSKILREYKERKEYVKPSIKKRLKKLKAIQKQKMIESLSENV